MVEPAQTGVNGSLTAGPAYRAAADAGFAVPRGTLYDSFMRSLAECGGSNCLGRRVGDSYHFLTYKQAGDLAARVGSALVRVGMRPGDRACVFGANCPEWMLAMQACNRHSVVCVPLYDVLGDNSVEYIISHSESSVVFLAASKLPVLAKALPKVLDNVKTIVFWGPVDANAEQALKDVLREGAGRVATYSFEDFVQLGADHLAGPDPPCPDDLCTIMYTSGTTGTPKGVPMTHHAVATAVAALGDWLDRSRVGVDKDDVYLSFLPLAHIYGRVMEEALLVGGGSIAYWSGDARLLPGDIRAAQPTIFSSVPRIFERFESSTKDQILKEGGLSEKLFHAAYSLKLAAIEAGAPWNKLVGSVVDRLVFRAVSKKLLGGRLKFFSSGGAPLAKPLEDFMRVVTCGAFLQGYGLTETCGSTFVTHPTEPDHMHSVGPPQPGITVRLEAIPSMDYDPLGTPPRGEILIKGDAVFKGYYKNEEETRKAIDADGWFHTGDVGEFTPTGSLRIIDRKKNIFKLSQGEYIAVEKIEGVLGQSPLVSQIWVHGDRFESCLVAVVVPSRSKLEAWAAEHGLRGSFAELCGSEEVRSLVVKELANTGRREGLKPFELPKAVLLEPAGFSVANDLLTPTLELRRRQLSERYAPQIEAMYAGLKAKAAGRGG
ncbi:hypothetical protein N2152v2_002535 [Parachlorella kessleri]